MMQSCHHYCLCATDLTPPLNMTLHLHQCLGLHAHLLHDVLESMQLMWYGTTAVPSSGTVLCALQTSALLWERCSESMHPRCCLQPRRVMKLQLLQSTRMLWALACQGQLPARHLSHATLNNSKRGCRQRQLLSGNIMPSRNSMEPPLHTGANKPHRLPFHSPWLQTCLSSPACSCQLHLLRSVDLITKFAMIAGQLIEGYLQCQSL